MPVATSQFQHDSNLKKIVAQPIDNIRFDFHNLPSPPLFSRWLRPSLRQNVPSRDRGTSQQVTAINHRPINNRPVIDAGRNRFDRVESYTHHHHHHHHRLFFAVRGVSPLFPLETLVSLPPSLPPHPVYGPLTLASTAPSLPPPSVCVRVCVCVQLKRRKGERNSLA